MNPLVSVIVPCYNQAQYLPETLDSVLAQTYPYWECIIVNDGSPDNTEEIANQYCDKDSRFKYLYKENGGLSSARNAGIKSSKGEFILPLDSDDLIGIAYLEKAIEHFTNHPETKLVYCKAQMFGEVNKLWDLPTYEYEKLLLSNQIFCSAFYKKVDFELTTGYNESLKSGLEDWDFWLQLLDKESTVYRLPEVHFHYRIREGSMIRSMNQNEIMEARKNIYNNHRNKFEEYVPNLIWQNKLIEQLYDTIEKKEFEISRIRASKRYRLGKFILNPLRLIKKLKSSSTK